MYKKGKTQNGITLIALVITIIVMLILVGVTISMAVNGGLFDYAGKAVSETNNALKAEQQLANGGITIGGKYYNSIEEYLEGDTGKVTGTYANAEKDENGMLTANATYIQGGYTATIPKGFKVSDVAAEQTITEGLVIEDEAGNQFVWIPVKSGEFERTGWWENEPTDKTLDEITEDWEEEDYKEYLVSYYGYNSLDEMIEDRGYTDYEEMLDSEWGGTTLESTIEWFKDCYYLFGVLSENYTESSTNDPTGEYDNMLASVQKYGGFYIGRFEAGSNENRYTTKTDETVLVQKGAYPYNYVVWGTSMTNYEDEYTSGSTNYGHGAVYLSKNMYTGEEYGVTSTLCYGVQWDAALRFVKDKVDVTNSTNWGNYYNHEFTFTGKYSTDSGKTWKEDVTNETKPEDNRWLLTTGASEANKAKNIYDLAGNVYEWTMEASSTYGRVTRGGSCNVNGSDYPASSRYVGGPTNSSHSFGFRPSLYLK